MSTRQAHVPPLVCTIFARAVAIVLWACRNASACEHCYDLNKADSILEIFDHSSDGARAVDPIATIKERDLREALDECVKAVRSDRLNHGHSQKLLDLLQLVTDDYQRLALFENVEGALLHEGGENAPMREAAGLLSANLGEAMDRTGKHTTDPFVQEAFFRHSIRIFPESPVALRSLGYKFEQSGQELRAMELYREGLARSPERLDLRLLLASSCSPFLDDTPHQGDMRFSRVSAEIRRLVKHIQTSDTPLRNVPNPGRDLIHIPSFSWQYLGRNMRPLMESLCWILAAMTVGLHEAIARLHPRNAWDNSISSGEQGTRGALGEGQQPPISLTPPPGITTRDVRITVGFVMERWGNRSPHRLIQGVLEGMDRSRFRLVVFSRDYTGYYCEAGKALLEVAAEVKMFPWHPFAEGLADPFADRGVIASVQVDVLLYAALGNTLWSHLLALGRLAPVQIVFGHGHPMTSGSPGIDYFVSSDLFETTASIDARELRRIAGTASDLSLATTVTNDAGAEGCDDDDSVHSPTARDTCQADTLRSGDGQPHHYENLPRSRTHQTLAEEKRNTTQNLEPWRGRGGEGEQDYAEQLVLFDSLTASLSEVFGPENAPSSAVAAVVAAAAPSRPRAEMSLEEGDHLYHCIQHSKKFHPDFDQVMRGVLQRDPAAKILLTAGSEVHLPRWGRTLGIDLVERLVFLPHLPHSEMLLVVANCKAMLDTFPWGGGVTSLEALLAGVPVVTLPARISVLPLAAGQLAELGVDEELVASDVEGMVKKAVKLATDSTYREKVSAAILSQKSRLSEPHRATREWEQFLERAVRSAVPLDAKI